jgi:acetoacetate decarboxylase
VQFALEEVELKGVWSGPGMLELRPHALAPVAALPILEVISSVHILTDLTLPLGTVVYDYMR